MGYNVNCNTRFYKIISCYNGISYRIVADIKLDQNWYKFCVDENPFITNTCIVRYNSVSLVIWLLRSACCRRPSRDCHVRPVFGYKLPVWVLIETSHPVVSKHSQHDSIIRLKSRQRQLILKRIRDFSSTLQRIELKNKVGISPSVLDVNKMILL